MKILLIIIFFSLCQASIAAEPADSLAYWKKLLHFGADGSRVVSKEFFLTSEGDHDALAELNKTVEVLNNPGGQQVACAFPARYRWLRKRIKTVPLFDMKACAELNRFKSDLQMQTISLVFASEYLDNPVSSFGHTMLVFHDKDKALMSADVVHFAAKTDSQDGFVKYTWKGLTGGYPGYFTRDPFFKKQQQYNIIEQRYIHLYTLNFTADQIENIVDHLFELQKARFKYYFINENCAYQIGNLLDVGTDEIGFSESGFVLPIEVIKKQKDRIKSYRVLYPAAVTVRQLVSGMTEIEEDQFAQILAGSAAPVNTLSDRVKQALVVYYEYHFRKNHISSPNYTDVMQLRYQPVMLDIPAPQPLQQQNASRMVISHVSQAHQERLRIAYRPFLHDLFDIQMQEQPDFELSLFSPVVQLTDEVVSLYAFDLFEMKSLPERSRFFNPLSWQFYTGLNRNNPDEELDFETEFGLGLTYRLGIVMFNGSLNIGVDLSEGDYYYKPNASLLLRLGDRLKIGIDASEKYYQDDHYIERNVFASFGFDQNALHVQYKTTSASDEPILEAAWFHYF